MLPSSSNAQAPVPPAAFHRGHTKQRHPLHMDALTLVTRLHLLALCRLAVRYAHWRCPPPLSAGPGGRPRRYCEESLLLLALLRTLWHLSYQDMHDWVVSRHQCYVDQPSTFREDASLRLLGRLAILDASADHRLHRPRKHLIRRKFLVLNFFGEPSLQLATSPPVYTAPRLMNIKERP